MIPPPPRSTLFPYTTLFRSVSALLGRMPSAVGYQPNLNTEIGELQERITNFGVQVRLITRSEEHTSELQSHSDLVCRLLLEKKKHTACTANVIRPQASTTQP